MSRGFRDQPVNLIHRIPTPEQMSAARPLMKASFGQRLAETLKGWTRAAADLFRPLTRDEGTALTMDHAGPASRTESDELINAPVDDVPEYLNDGSEQSDVLRPQPWSVATSSRKEETMTLQFSTPPEAVQPEEVAELRSFLLRQQQDIARLSGQIQELKSLVVSQQQVLVYLGKELEVDHTQVPSPTAVASAPPKRNRIVREKTTAKDKPFSHKGTSPPSLNL